MKLWGQPVLEGLIDFQITKEESLIFREESYIWSFKTLQDPTSFKSTALKRPEPLNHLWGIFSTCLLQLAIV